jgi:hypothetical protein
MGSSAYRLAPAERRNRNFIVEMWLDERGYAVWGKYEGSRKWAEDPIYPTSAFTDHSVEG